MPFLATAAPAIAGALGIGAGAKAIAGGGGSGSSGDYKMAPDDGPQKSADFEWGGKPGMAAQGMMTDQSLGADWAAQAAPQADYGQANGYAQMGDQDRGIAGQSRGMANESRGMGLQDRGAQLGSLGMMRDAAMGNAPSQAENMMRQGNDQAMANQMSMAAGARGPAAMAMAQQQAAGNQSVMSTNNQNNMGALRAQEMAQARGAYAGQANNIAGSDANMRGQDLGQQGADLGQRNADLGYMGQSSQNAQNQAQLQMQQHQLGLSGQLGFMGMSNDVAKAQLGGRMGYQGYKENAAQANAANNANSRDANTNNWLTGLGTAASVVEGAMKPSDEGVKDGIRDIGMGSAASSGPAGVPLMDDYKRASYAGTGPAASEPTWGAKAGSVVSGALRAGAHPGGGLRERLDGLHPWQPPQLPDATPMPQVAVSDEHAKERTAELGDLDQAFSHMPPKSFAYKPGVPGERPGIHQAGIIAQDAEKHPLTAAMVRETPHGKAIDLGTATSLNLAANSEHSQRLRALEAQLGDRRGRR